MHPVARGKGCDPDRCRPHLVVALEGTALSVRKTLAELRPRFGALCLGHEGAGAVELVLAEVLNNIC